MLQSHPWMKLRSLNQQFEYEIELASALAELRVTPNRPPTRGSAGFALTKLEFVMNPKRDGGKMAKAVEEICDLPVVKDALMKMIQSGEIVRMDAALKVLPGIIAALCRASVPAKKDEDKSPELDTTELD